MRVSARRNVFETNSSSVHAITFYPSGDRNSPKGGYRIGLGEYGWDDEIADPAAYLWTAVCAVYRGDEAKVSKWRDDIDYVLGGGCTFDDPDKEPFYIDHDWEVSGLLDMLENNLDLLRAYLLGKDTEVQVSNDNGGAFCDEWYADPDFGPMTTSEKIVYLKGN